MWNRELAEIDLSELKKDKQVLVFEYNDPFGQPAHGFALMWEGELRAYRNLCPHWSVALDHNGKFFDDEGEELMCHMHGATFDPGTGRCTWGPPHGAKLETFDLEENPDKPGFYKVMRRAGISLL